jgi:endo-1,4-beta-xylanase
MLTMLWSLVSSGTWTAAELTAVIQTHISNEVGHFKGQCRSWDVVNEALTDSATYEEDVFYEVLGTSYIPIAFEAAALADPDAKLYYNDYNIETVGAKQEAALGIISLLQSAGAKIDGIGLESHFIVGESPTASELEAAMQSYLAAGVTEVAITELDIRFTSLPASTSGLAEQGDEYAAVVQACLAVSACVGITVWDFTDLYSWIPATFSGEGEACLYDDNLSKKPAWTSVSSALAAATGSSSATTTSTLVSTTLKTSTVSSTASKTTTTTTTSATGSCATPVAEYGQCGGLYYYGCTTCASGSTCTYQNDYYSQCL